MTKIPNEIKKNILNMTKKMFKENNEKKYLIAITLETDKGEETKFLSTYNDKETIGVIEKIKITALTKVIESEQNKNNDFVDTKEKLSYVN